MEEFFSAPSMIDFPLSGHLAMVQDATRVRAFSRALRAVLEPGATVVDVGAGTGVLAFHAARYGAGRVVGIERSEIARYAMKVKALTCPQAPITFVRRDILLDPLPRVRADVVVCELLGNFGIEENIVAVLDRVRRQLLKPGGTIIPRRLELIISPVQCARAYREISAWSKPLWGIDFSPLSELAFNAVYHVTQDPLTVLAQPATLACVDFTSTSRPPRPSAVTFRFTRRGTLHGFAGWFRADLAPGVVLDNGPDQPETHWRQVLFPVGEPLSVERGGAAEFAFTERSSSDEVRWSWSGAVRPRIRGRRRRFEFSAVRPPH